MNESAAAARRIALQLGDDLDEILGSASNDVVIDVDAATVTGVELRQIAGLTAGAAMRLTDGTYEFGQSNANQRGLNSGTPEEVGFTLTVKDNEAWITSVDAAVTLDGEAIDGTTKVGASVIEVGSARFMVAVPRRPSRRRTEETPRLDAIPPIALPDLDEISSSAPKARSSILQAIRGDAPDPVAEHVIGLVRANRSNVLHRRREIHPNPEEIVSRARGNRAWDRRSNHPHFAEVALAFGDVPWRPVFERPDLLSTKVVESFQHLSTAPSIPITADLRRGPVGIIGSRPAVLSVARHLVVTLSTLSPPNDLTVAVLADQDRAGEWTWADHLPHNTPENDTAFPVLVVDGLHHAREPSLAEMMASVGQFGCILLGDRIDDLPPTCSAVMLIDDHGTATVMDNRDGTTTMAATPLGLTPDLATVAVNALNSFAFAAS